MKSAYFARTVAISGISLMFFASSAIANNFNIEVSNDDISVEANNASLRELMLELEKQTGIPVKFVADTDERVSLSVGLSNLEHVIGKITPNHMIVHETQNGKSVIKELIIIPNDSGGSSGGNDSSFLPSGQPAPVIDGQTDQAMPSPALEAPNTQPMQPPPEGEPPLPNNGDVN